MLPSSGPLTPTSPIPLDLECERGPFWATKATAKGSRLRARVEDICLFPSFSLVERDSESNSGATAYELVAVEAVLGTIKSWIGLCCF